MSEINQEVQPLEDNGVNQELGYENVPVADHGVNQTETYQVDWENETRKFQSMYDKQKAENDKMKQDMEYLAQEFAKNQKSQRNSNVNNQSSLPEDEFNPWDAYYKPESPSYKHRVKKEQETVGSAVNQIRGEFAQREAQAQQRQFLNTTVNELKSKHNMNDEQVNHFLEWSAQPKEAVGLGNLVKLWQDVNSSPVQGQTSIDAVKATQKVPPSAGVLQGQAAETVSDDNKAFDKVLSASKMGRLG